MIFPWYVYRTSSAEEKSRERCKHINLAANVCEYTPINLGEIIKKGILSDIASIHRLTIDHAVERRKEND